MKISLIQPTTSSAIWIHFETNDMFTRVFVWPAFDPFEDLYIWLGQIRDSLLPESMKIMNEEGCDVEFIAEVSINGMIQFRIETRSSRDDATTCLTTTIQSHDLIKAFYDGISEFLENEYRPFDWSLIDILSNINWKTLLNPPNPLSQNWQKRLSMSRSGWGGKREKINSLEREKLKQEHQWLLALENVLYRIAIMAGKRKLSSIQALANLYQTLPVNIALGEVDPDWYQSRRKAIDEEYGVEKLGWLISREEREYRHTLRKTRLKMLRVGQVLDGTVLLIKPYGLIVDIGGFAGLLHISSISQIPVEKLDSMFKLGDWVRVMIVWMDIEKGRVSLSTSDLEVEPGDMLKHPWKVYETAEEMAERYYQNVLSKQNAD